MSPVDPSAMKGMSDSVETDSPALAALRDDPLKALFPAPAMMWLSNPDGKRVFSNEALLTFLGRPAEKELGLGWLEAIHEDDADACLGILSRAALERSSCEKEHRVMASDRGFRWVQTQAVPLWGDEGDLVGFVGTMVDVHELRSSNAYGASLRHIVEESVNEVYVFDPETLLFLEVNHGAQSNLGYSLDELKTMTPVDIKPEFTAERFSRMLAPLHAGERQKLRFETVHQRKNGTHYPVEVHLQLSQLGASPAYVAIILDTTERETVQKSLRQRERTINALLESAAQGIIALGRDGKIAFVNAEVEAQFGHSREEIEGKPIEDLIPLEFADSHIEHRRRFFENPHRRQMGRGLELAGRRKDGSEFPVEISLNHIETDAGSLAVAFVSDITERKSLEREQRKAEREKVELEKKLNQAVKMEAVGRLAGGIAHDFNNLITAMTGFSEIVLDELEGDHPLREGAQQTLKMCQRSAKLIRQLLAVSRRQMVRPTTLNLNARIADMSGMFDRILGENIEIVVSLAPDLHDIDADESQVEQVLMNLIVNARDAMPRGGQLKITTENVTLDDSNKAEHVGLTLGEHVMVTVADSGEGMNEESLRRIFEPFYTTKEENQGTGLGLATVYGIIEQNGGRIDVESSLGEGSVFKILLPKSTGIAHRGNGPLPEPTPPGSETILVVEDESVVSLTVKRSLERAGYTVLTARGADEAISLAKQHSSGIDLVLSDVVLPGLSGPEIVAQVTRHHPDVRPLYMSGYANDEVAQRGILREGVAFIEKPFTRETLTTKVREVLES